MNADADAFSYLPQKKCDECKHTGNQPACKQRIRAEKQTAGSGQLNVPAAGHALFLREKKHGDA